MLVLLRGGGVEEKAVVAAAAAPYEVWGKRTVHSHSAFSCANAGLWVRVHLECLRVRVCVCSLCVYLTLEAEIVILVSAGPRCLSPLPCF